MNSCQFYQVLIELDSSHTKNNRPAILFDVMLLGNYLIHLFDIHLCGNLLGYFQVTDLKIVRFLKIYENLFGNSDLRALGG